MRQELCEVGKQKAAEKHRTVSCQSDKDDTVVEGVGEEKRQTQCIGGAGQCNK